MEPPHTGHANWRVEMVQSEIEDARSTGRRVRHVARDGLAAAAVSLGGSVALTLALWLVVRWVG
ncbi:hypothetical protein GCM10009616_39750 [Microlunatus lacustris]